METASRKKIHVEYYVTDFILMNESYRAGAFGSSLLLLLSVVPSLKDESLDVFILKVHSNTNYFAFRKTLLGAFARA